MLCERCDNSEATFHLTEISNNVQSELHLCIRCAKNAKLNSRIQDDSLSLKTMFSFLDDDDRLISGENDAVCLNCGLTGIELSLDGRPGCPSCYKYFRSALSTISGANYANKYFGKKPLNYIEVIYYQNSVPPPNKADIETLESLVELEEELRVAVMEERYEDAAKLRDRIKEVKAIE